MPKAVAAAIGEATMPDTTIQFRQANTEALAEEEEMERDPTVFVAGEDVGLMPGLYERLALLDKIHHGQQTLPLLGQEAGQFLLVDFPLLTNRAWLFFTTGYPCKRIGKPDSCRTAAQSGMAVPCLVVSRGRARTSALCQASVGASKFYCRPTKGQ